MTRTFLIADDSAGKMTMLKSVLHAAKWEGEIFTATTTEEAIALIDSHPIDCAFIDYYIPSTNGPAVIKHLRSAQPNAKIALVSSADNTENAQEARDAGVNTVICVSNPGSEELLKELLLEWKTEMIA